VVILIRNNFKNKIHFLIPKQTSSHILNYAMDKYEKKIIVVKTIKGKGLRK
jgi:hypothetical protein